MEKYIFGMKAEKASSDTVGEFKQYTMDDGGNWNPYNSAYFDNPENSAVTEEQGKITSIPSPYARMHITDLAFREANSGKAAGGQAKALSKDYNKALSHCLDLFELMFNSDSIDFKVKGITIEKIDLITTNNLAIDAEAREFFNENPKLKNYVATLDLFRREYNQVIKSRNVAQYKFDFTSLYIFKQNGKSFAATSPFTGFYAKADCNIENIEINGRKILNSDPATWMNMIGRQDEFRYFMYSLLKDTNLSAIFGNLYKHIEYSLTDKEKTSIENGPIFQQNKAYRKFNFDKAPLQKLRNQDVYIRPDGLDCSYLKYLLYLDNPVDFNINENDYLIDLEERLFNGKPTQWLGVNDILSDSLFVLTYEINDNYLTIPYTDFSDGAEKKRCLIPVKKDALKYFTINDISECLSITRKDSGTYLVTLKVSLQNGGVTIMRREYQAENVIYPNGKVFQGDEVKPFAFGIYPFIKSSHYTNLYKVLFYNNFKGNYSLKFYKRLNGNIHQLTNVETTSNKTNSINNRESRVNCEYHDITLQNGSFEFAEITVDENYTSLIVPKLRVVGGPGQQGVVDIQHIPGKVTVAIDLGTSNTYVAYTHEPLANMGMQPINQICTHHQGAGNSEWNELTFMNKRVGFNDLPDAPDKNREDLYLRVNDRQAPVDTWLSAQLNEFIPSRIEPGTENYSFPIPTVINFLRNQTERTDIMGQNAKNQNAKNQNTKNQIPLLNFSIPFAYYERGVRSGAQPYYYDLIRDGSDFKWFMKRDRFGNSNISQTDKAAFKAFLSELMFIVRCHLICQGYDLNQCRIIWSYPLSFSSQLRSQYDFEWKAAFKEFINNNINGRENEYVMYTNESRSPIYDCIDKPNAINQLTLLLDIGGGSTDVIGYKHNEVKFVTSFAFAGNALYLNSDLNTVQSNLMDNTLLKKYIRRQPIFNDGNSSPMNDEMVERKIDLSQSISTLMNYGFTKARLDFENIFQNAPAKYMLYIHNAAIAYHVAQLCKIYSPDEIPANIYLSGNGSKLFNLNTQRESMIRKIFNFVYGREAIANHMNICNNQNPKAATVNGALKGLSDGTLATNAASMTNCIVMLGDSSTIAEFDGDGNAIVNAAGNYREDVKKNVLEFFNLFYQELYNTATPQMTQEEIERFIDNVSGDPRLQLPQNGLIEHSLFFQYIALVMQEISFELARRGAAG